jgi:hypothetical protein
MKSDSEILRDVESIARKYMKRNSGKAGENGYRESLYGEVTQYLSEQGVKNTDTVYKQAAEKVDSMLGE